MNAAQRVIARFGGQAPLARLLGKRQSTVEHWAKTGRIPTQWHRTLLALARERGVMLEPRDFVPTPPREIAPANGKLGVLLVGLGAVASTFIAGVEHARRGTGKPIGFGITGPGMTDEEAMARVDKGADAVDAAMAMHELLRGL